MIVTDTSLKALTNCPSSQLYVPEIRTNKILLDECVTIRTHSIQSLGEYEFYHSTAIVGKGAPDCAVANAAIENNCMLVTADRRFMRLSLGANMQVGYFNQRNGKVYVWREVMTLPVKETGGAPIKLVKVNVAIKPIKKRSFWVKITRLFR
jgi:hypothetical protein